MQIIEKKFLFDYGDFSISPEFSQIMIEIESAIKSVTWGHNEYFLINPVKLGNGVTPIKKPFINFLKEKDWKTEYRLNYSTSLKPGPLDAVKFIDNEVIALEWETGNVSSSHRALNKLALGIINGKISVGVLIVPTKNFARFLTDRIGNWEELSSYFPLYNNISLSNGSLIIIGINYDDVSLDSPIIPKGSDGNSKKNRKNILDNF
jgi:hypothetical protein